MNKEDWLRIAEKLIEEMPELITATASLVTAITVFRQTKSVNPNPTKEKGKRC